MTSLASRSERRNTRRVVPGPRGAVMTAGEARFASVLDALGLALTVHEHPPVATVAEAHEHWSGLNAEPVKNLFLKDASGAFWLVVASAERRIDLKTLPARIGSKRLRFASPDDLALRLGVEPGAVSPLAVVNDPDGVVHVVLDTALSNGPALALHPLRNTATVVLGFDDLTRFLAKCAHVPISVDLD